MSGRFIDSVIFKRDICRDLYLNEIPAVQFLRKNRSLPFDSDVTFFVGENGMGKSTLLEAVAVAYGFNAEGGSKNFQFSTKKTHSELGDCLTVSRSRFAKDGFFLRAESFYNVATNLDEMDEQPAGAPPLKNSYGGLSLNEQSHGESFLSLVHHRFGGNGMYILDEPEAALSPAKLLTLIAEINLLVKNNSQFIIATHSPMLLTFPGAAVYQFSEAGIQTVSYQQTEHFQLAKRFLDNPERMLAEVLDGGKE